MVYAYLGTKEDSSLPACAARARLLESRSLPAVEPAAGHDQQLWYGLRAFFGFVVSHRTAGRPLPAGPRQEPFDTN